MKRVLIVGGGISGLIASYVFSACRELDVKVLEPGQPGGEFTLGGLKYIHRTDEMASMLSDLGEVFSNYTVRGGILLKGDVHPYPKVLGSIANPDRVRYDHYKKTRRQEPSEFSARAMNDPEDVDAGKSLRCDFQSMIKKLALRASFIKARLARIEPGFILSDRGQRYEYDFLILTIPLWVVRHVAYFDTPEGMAMSLNITNVLVNRDEYSQWDYVYTPYTPGDTIHRISPMDGKYSCESNGEMDGEKLLSDLNFLFPFGWSLVDQKLGVKGHLLPLSEPPSWPENIFPLGRFAKWDPRSTADVVLADALEIAKQHGWTARQVHD